MKGKLSLELFSNFFSASKSVFSLLAYYLLPEHSLLPAILNQKDRRSVTWQTSLRKSVCLCSDAYSFVSCSIMGQGPAWSSCTACRQFWWHQREVCRNGKRGTGWKMGPCLPHLVLLEVIRLTLGESSSTSAALYGECFSHSCGMVEVDRKTATGRSVFWRLCKKSEGWLPDNISLNP